MKTDADRPALLQNALYFPEHDFYLPSTHVHDYREFEYLPGEFAMVDGGTFYLRRSVTPPEHAHLVVAYDLYDNDPRALVLERLLWGSLPLDPAKLREHTYRPIRTLSKDHLAAILANRSNIGVLHCGVMEHWLSV